MVLNEKSSFSRSWSLMPKNRTSPTLGYIAIGLGVLSIILNGILLATGNSPYERYYNR